LVLWLGLVGLGNLLTTPVALAGDDVKRYGHVADLSENSTHYANYLLGSKSVLSSRPAQSEILIREPEPPKPPAPKLAPPERPEPAPYKETTTVQIKPLPQPEIGNGPIITRRSPPLFRDPLQMGGEGPEMAIVPAGTFSMGDVLGSGQRDEQPVHEVSMKRFAMSVYEVTFFEYDLFAEATGRQKPNDKGWGRGNRPVINVSWEDAVAYAKWLSQQTDLQYHLPTEAQWEYAARAGAQTEYSWGNDIGRNRANCAVCGSKWSNKQTAPVGSFPANPFGLYDMVANVYEWTCSANDKRYRRKKEQRCSCKESARYYCVYRGGSWRSLPKYARAANRSRGKKSYRNNNLGFRVAREIRE
jgi:formylglycine-generating enzyme required for sulfatase activity